MGQRRIKFYSVNDMGTGWHLQKIEAFFQDWDILTDNPDVNTILELFNIKKFLDAGVRLVQWSDLQLEEYKEKEEFHKSWGNFVVNYQMPIWLRCAIW